MAQVTINGTIKLIGKTQQVSDKFSKRELVLTEPSGQRPQQRAEGRRIGARADRWMAHVVDHHGHRALRQHRCQGVHHGGWKVHLQVHPLARLVAAARVAAPSLVQRVSWPLDRRKPLVAQCALQFATWSLEPDLQLNSRMIEHALDRPGIVEQSDLQLNSRMIEHGPAIVEQSDLQLNSQMLEHASER
jgi:hypothetical protein